MKTEYESAMVCASIGYFADTEEQRERDIESVQEFKERMNREWRERHERERKQDRS